MRAGEEEAFDEFADHYIPALHRFAASQLRGDSELVRDVVQSALCKAIRSLGAFRGDASLYTWLCACCRNEIAMHYRRKERTTTVLGLDGHDPASAEGGPEERVLEREADDLVHRALDHLPPRYATALEWMYLEEASVNEIARRLGRTPKAVESMLTRARAAFRTAWTRLTEDR